MQYRHNFAQFQGICVCVTRRSDGEAKGGRQTNEEAMHESQEAMQESQEAMQEPREAMQESQEAMQESRCHQTSNQKEHQYQKRTSRLLDRRCVASVDQSPLACWTIMAICAVLPLPSSLRQSDRGVVATSSRPRFRQ